MSTSQTNSSQNGIVSVSDTSDTGVKYVLKWLLTGLPLGGVIWASFLPIQTWMQQALVLVTLIWFFVFFLLDTFFLTG